VTEEQERKRGRIRRRAAYFAMLNIFAVYMKISSKNRISKKRTAPIITVFSEEGKGVS
jgi:hypothetical protein